MMSRTKRIILAVVVAAAGYVGWVFFQPDDALAPALRGATHVGERQVSEATIGLIGLDAPAGSDFMKHGRLALAEAARTGGYVMEAATSIRAGKPRLEVTWQGDLDCWLFPPGEKIHEEFSKNCTSPAQLQTALVENAEMLERYRAIQKLPVTADGESFRGQTTIKLSKLIVADIANDLRQGQDERAYRKWADNQLHQAQMAGYGGSWTMTAINMVNEGLSFTGLDLLLAKAPDLMQSHRAELLKLVKPRGNVGKDIATIANGELRLFEQIRGELLLQRFVGINRLRNRIAVYSSEVVDAIATHPAAVAAISTVNARHSAWRVSDIFDPITASAWQLLMSSQLKTGDLIGALFRKEAQRRLYTIKIMRAAAKAPNTDIEADMKSAPSELRSPFDGTPAQWDASTRTLFFNVVGGTGRVQEVLSDAR